jgi:two-component system phosphate regulon response regulator PhoB
MAKILIIEDDALIARLYQKVFTFEGHEVAMAANGEEGLEKLKTFAPTLILLDIMMPKVNGLQVLEKLKADPQFKNVPVVMLTNLAGDQDAQKALAMGAVKYIIKSEYQPKQVARMIKEILAGYTRHEVPKTGQS